MANWRQITNVPGKDTSERIIDDSDLLRMMAQCHLNKQAGEDFNLKTEVNRKYEITAYIFERKLPGKGTVITRFERLEDSNNPCKVTEARYLDATTLRSICIKYSWYTRGTNDEYGKLFDRLYDADGCNKNLTTELLNEIATDIYQHSEISDYSVGAMMNVLARACTYFFEEVG